MHLLPKTEWLDRHIIETVEEAQDFATQWLWTYNNGRPNMGIGGITPAMKLNMAAEVLRMHPAERRGDCRDLFPTLFGTVTGKLDPRDAKDLRLFDTFVAAARHAGADQALPRCCLLSGTDRKRSADWAMPIEDTAEGRADAVSPAAARLTVTSVERENEIDPWSATRSR